MPRRIAALSLLLLPQGKVNYTVQIKDGVWTETGEFVGEGQPPRKFLEMTLRKKG
jgi:hypothetical protein